MSTFTKDNISLDSIKHLLASVMNRWDSILNSQETITATELSKYDNELAELKSFLVDINNLELYSDISLASSKITELENKLITIESDILSKFESADNAISQNIDLFNQDKISKFEDLQTQFDDNLVTLNQSFSDEKILKFNEIDTLVQDIQTKLDNGFFKGSKGDKGDKGDKGEALTFNDLTPEQIDSLKVVNPEDFYTKEDINAFLLNKADITLLSQKADIDTLNQVLATLQSNDLNLDTLQEIVDYITLNRETLQTLTLDNISCGTLYKKVTVELYTKLTSLRTNQEIDLLLAEKANSTGSTEKTFKVANAQQSNEAVNLQQIQSMLSSLTLDFSSITNVPNLGGNPIGTVITLATTSIPNGYLYCNGQEVLRADYQDLFNTIGETFGSGDEINTFNVPDLRGYFTRGYDDNRGIDSGRTFASIQTDDLKSHNHTGSTNTTGAHTHTCTGAATSSGGAFPDGIYTIPSTVTTSSSGNHSHTLTINSTGGPETRPKNIALVYAIKY